MNGNKYQQISVYNIDLGGLIGVATAEKNGLMASNGFFTKSAPSDANNIIESGIYNGSDITNVPLSSYFVIIVFRKSTDIIQLFFSMSGGGFYFRISGNTGKSWEAWKKIALT